MAVLTAPLLSFDARGKIADTLVFSNWRGVPYARRMVIPANPKTIEQMITRDTFTALELRWKQAGALMRAPWRRFAVGRKFVGRNAYLGKNIAVIRGDAGMDDYLGSPGAKGGLPLTSMALTTVAGGVIECAVVAPAAPNGWTLTSAIATFLKDQAANAVVTDIIQEGEDLAATTIDVTGLDTVAYWVQAWTKWDKGGGEVAYGPSISDTIVVT